MAQIILSNLFINKGIIVKNEKQIKSNQKKLSNEELASFCSQIAIMLHAGITPAEGVRILLSDTKDTNSQSLLKAILDSINDGNNFAESLSSVGVFPDYVLNTIKLGEEAGSLDEVMTSLANYYERETQISESVKSAITYPLVMIVMMLAVIVILITKVLPIFNQVFIQLGSEMTGFAASLMSLGKILNRYSVIFIAVLVIFIVMYIIFSKSAKGRYVARKLASKLHLFRSFYEGVAAGRFASGMALALSAGLDTFESLRLVASLVEHDGIEKKIAVCKERIEQGDNFAEGLKASEIFSNVNNRMVAVGFKSGEIETIMNKIADEYERKSERKINEIISIIEPTLVIILSIIVGLILLSVILPLMGIMTTIG